MPEDAQQLLAAADAVMRRAHVPYSGAEPLQTTLGELLPLAFDCGALD